MRKLTVIFRRRCAVCGGRLRRRDWRTVMVVEGGGERPAHWGCVASSDAAIQRFFEEAE